MWSVRAARLTRALRTGRERTPVGRCMLPPVEAQAMPRDELLSAATVTLALLGDTMLGRGVGERLRTVPPSSLFGPALLDALREADLVVLNLECCISRRGERWPDPSKPFFFRAPPAAVDALALLGVDCVTLANNHALDYGPDALLDTLEHLRAGGIAV
ncbi:MAG TPA: CapA family protein, partial [Gaiellaceae bacterium]|nr:CapA family protein [Gaiellaceae bacterium]